MTAWAHHESSLDARGVASISPFLHTKAVIGIVGKVFGFDDETRADMRTASTRAFRRGFADANDTRLTGEELAAPCPTLPVAGEREPVRASNAALAALMPQAEARYVAGKGHGLLGEEPDLHMSMVQAWLTGQELPDLTERPAAPSPRRETRLDQSPRSLRQPRRKPDRINAAS